MKPIAEQYMRDKYGLDFVTGMGSYNAFKIKAAVKALNRGYGIETKKSNIITSVIDAKGDYTELFKNAKDVPMLREFIQNYPHIIEKLPLILNGPSTASIHASGTIITPKETKEGYYKDISTWMPVKKVDGQIVSEWNVYGISKMGFLKFDILGLQQLDKFQRMNELIELHTGKKLTYDDIDLENEGVFDLFKEGLNQDVFQFTSSGLIQYCKDFQPSNVSELSLIAAVYRPGPISMNAHIDLIKVKKGEKEIKYDYMLEDLTKETYGFPIYQEQIMSITTILGGFTLTEADSIRKAMVLQSPAALKKYEDQFISGCLKNNCPEDEANTIWEKLCGFGCYTYNKSHSVCYSLLGYFSQWYKYNYPLEFWTTALEFSESDELIQKIAEIEKLGIVTVAPVDINKSKDSFYPDVNTQKIYWSLNSIKWVGKIAVEEVVLWRSEDGEYFSLEEFVERVEKRKVNKRSVENLIFAGAFDEIEKIVDIRDRYKLLVQYYEQSNNKKLLPELEEYRRWPEYKWIIRQRELTGFGFINFFSVLKTSEFKKFVTQYISGDTLQENTKLQDKEVIVGGCIKEIIERKSKRGPFCQIALEENFVTTYITMWNESYEQFYKELKENIGSICFIKGKVVTDNYKHKQVIHTTNDTILTIL
jgi:DNA polymerase-3 subunit alpha